MQKIIPIREINPEKVVIAKNENVLLYSDGPMLYWGQTKNGTLIIGLAVESVNRYIHIKVSSPELADFLSQKITLYSLFRYYKKKLYVIDYEDNSYKAYECEYNGVPEAYMPDIDFFPPTDNVEEDESVIDISSIEPFKSAFEWLTMSYRQINKLPYTQKKRAQKLLKLYRKMKYEGILYNKKNR